MSTAANDDKPVADIPLETLKTFSLGDALPCQYRFLSITHFLEQRRLVIVASPLLPTR